MRFYDLLPVLGYIASWIMMAHLYRDRNSERRRRFAASSIATQLQAQLTVSEGQVENLKAQIEAAPSKECQTWIDRWAQSVKDHQASHAAAERFLMERNQLQTALNRIEYAATTAQPVSDDELMKALESEDRLRKHYDYGEPLEAEPAKEYRGGCMGHV